MILVTYDFTRRLAQIYNAIIINVQFIQNNHMYKLNQ